MPMRHTRCFAFFLAASLLTPLPLAAQTPGQPTLSTCLLTSTSAADRTTLVRWIFAVVAVHPALRDLTAIPDSTRDNLDRSVAHMIERLLSESCRREARATLASGGPSVFQGSFGVLGQTAMMDLISDPAVSAALGGLTRYFDADKLQKALADSLP